MDTKTCALPTLQATAMACQGAQCVDVASRPEAEDREQSLTNVDVWMA